MPLENLNLSSVNSFSQQIDLFMKQNPWALPALIAIQIWKFVWYGLAIYQTAFVKKQKAWFVILLICMFFLNDLGLLAILYLIFNRDNRDKKDKKSTKAVKSKK